MFVTGTSVYSSLVFSLLSYAVAVPSAIKVFNGPGTMHKGYIRFDASMLYALGFIGLFTIGGLTGLFLGAPRQMCISPRPILQSRISTMSWSGVWFRHSSPGCITGGPNSPGGCLYPLIYPIGRAR